MVLSAAGHQAETPSDLVRWARRRTSALVLLTLTRDSEWRLLARLHDAQVTLPIMVLIDADSIEQGVRAARAGARSVLPRNIAGDALQRTVIATMDGHAVLPAEVAARLAAGVPPESPQVVPPDRIGWLRQLASGVTVAQLADRVGYSERAMFRLLTALYRDIGARNRIDAIMLARDKGWI
ncbi:DNA-binding response regulator [Micromonospora sp. A3M-1-15]|uniref:DNA-binding response regulator n=1 Tax=Micromonospora sp. A3M-1-15 TaxID=2962035 RepID=UPI0020B8594F|nr:DNA-binding response regulator [Micromonospora sp. A3M-1-15]MCP3785263.1 DNA-binding response regulator [Micromonospora sp. A3M-1-15]